MMDRVMSLDDVLSFGMYQGATLQQVMRHDERALDWVAWALSEDVIKIDSEAEAEFDRLMQLRHDGRWNDYGSYPHF